MPSFDLLREPWIPVLLGSGEQTELGLADTLRRACDIRGLALSSPLEQVALHRLLLAILHRVYGPADEPAWEQLWRGRAVADGRLSRYLRQMAGRFDLFHPTRPFCQATGLPERLAGPVRRLAPDQAAGHQATLWDHHRDAEGEPVAPAQAARWLLAHQCFCLSGRCGDGRSLAAVPAGPLAHATIFMPLGENLAETLLLNLVPYAPARHAPLPVLDVDIAVWERETPPDREAMPAGYLDYLTWQARRVQLLPGGGGAGVSQAIVTPGRALSVSRHVFDPMLGYRRDREGLGAWHPLRWDRGGWWRHLAQLLRPSGECWRRPLTLELLGLRAARGLLPPGAGLRLAVFGLEAHKAHVQSWRRDEVVLPHSYLHDPQAVADLEIVARLAYRVSGVLLAHLRRLTDRPELRDRCLEGYWSGIELSGGLVLQELPTLATRRARILRAWGETCRRLALHARDRALDLLWAEPELWRRQTLAEKQFQLQLGHALHAGGAEGDADEALGA